jgi:hypothetical protein
MDLDRRLVAKSSLLNEYYAYARVKNDRAIGLVDYTARVVTRLLQGST